MTAQKQAGQRRASKTGRRGVWGIVALCLCAAALWARTRLSDDPKAYQRYLQGVQEAQAGQDTQAIMLWEAVERDNPDYADVRLQLARAYLRVGAPGKAVAQLEALTRRNPAYPGAQTLLCEAYIRNRQASPAITAGLAAIRQEPQSSVAHANLAAAYGATAYLADCERELLQAEKIDPNNPALFLTGAGFYQDGKNAAQAETQARRCLALEPNNARAAYLLGWSLTHQPLTPAREQEAVTVLRQSIALDAHDPRPFLELGDALLAQNKPKEAITALQQARTLAAQTDTSGGFTRKHWSLRAHVAQRLSRAYAIGGDQAASASALREAQSLQKSAAAAP